MGVGDSGKIPLAIAQPGYEKTAVIFCPSSRESELAMYSVQTSDGKALKRLETQTQCVVSCVYGQREHVRSFVRAIHGFLSSIRIEIVLYR